MKHCENSSFVIKFCPKFLSVLNDSLDELETNKGRQVKLLENHGDHCTCNHVSYFALNPLAVIRRLALYIYILAMFEVIHHLKKSWYEI